MNIKLKALLWFSIIFFNSFLSYSQKQANNSDKEGTKSNNGKYSNSEKKKKAIESKDSIKNDSLKIYKKIQRFSNKRKLTKRLYEEIFVLPNSKAESLKKTKKKKAKAVATYEGKIIRTIYITTLDPFGFDIYDTSKHATSIFERGGNFIHIKSKKITIRNQLLIKAGDSLDLFRLKESERLIRASGYVRDALITVKPIPQNNDSVDVYVLTQDRWALNFDAGVSTKNYAAKVIDNNFLGLGHTLSQSVFSSGWTDSVVNFKGQYTVPNIKNSFITLNGFYSTDKYYYNKGIEISRSFYSPLTVWAGGAEISNYSIPINFIVSDTSRQIIFIDYNNFDFWGAQSLGIGLGNKSDKDRATRLVYGMRYWQRFYYETLPKVNDRYATFQNHTTILGSVGTTYRGYYKDKFIFRYGVTEDVPIGSIFSLTGGVDQRDRGNRLYLGTKAGYAHHFSGIGYTALNIEFVSYFFNGKNEQSTLRVGLNYFTKLIDVYRWKFRQFLSAECVYGLNKDVNEILTINNENGLRGFNSPTLVGSNKLIVISQTQLYLPYSLLGFRFAPILYVGLGAIGNAEKSFINQQVFPVFALGMQVRNEQLILNTFQFIVGIYPYIPGLASPSFKLNPIRTYDFRFQNYDIGKPEIVSYY